MSVKQKRYSLLLLILLAGIAFILTCSDKIINNPETESIEFDLSVKFSSEQQQALAEVVTTYRVKIIADNDTITAVLEFNNGTISGLVENVPAGPNRIVIVEGLTSDGTVIYRGTTTVTVVVGQIVDANITLEAVGQLVRISPKYSDLNFGSKLKNEIKVNNIKNLMAISLTVTYDASVVSIDSVSKGPALPSPATFTYDSQTSSIITIQVTHTATIVDTAGDVTLAQLHFSPVLSSKCADSTNFGLTVNSLTAGGITPANIYVDDAKAKISRGNLIVTPKMLAFGAGVSGLNLDFKQVSVNDSCGNPIAFTISTQTDWVDLNTAQAGLTPGNIFIDVDTTGLETGHYVGTVKISAPRAINSPFEIAITLDIDKGARNLDVIPDTIYFVATENSALPSVEPFNVVETHSFNIDFTADEDIPWLSLSRVMSTTPDILLASVTTTDLAEGTYTGEITVSSVYATNPPQIVTVIYTVNRGPRIIAAEPTELNLVMDELDDLLPGQLFRVYETGDHNIPYTLTENISWLSLSQTTGVTEDTIEANVTTNQLAPGTYTDSIKVFSAEANNSAVYVRVTLTVNAVLKYIDADPDTLYFVAEQLIGMPEPQQFRVFETGGFAIPYSVNETADWLSLSGVNGTTEDTVTANVSTSTLAPGTYFDSITVFAPVVTENTATFVYVSLEITSIPKLLQSDRDTLKFYTTENAALPQPEIFEISEIHDFNISFNATESLDWLELSDIDGQTPDSITASITTTSLTPGFYTGSIMITSGEADNTPLAIVVTYEVREAAKYLAVDMDTLRLQFLQYDDVIPGESFNVTETGGYAIPFGATTNAPWLLISGVSGTTPDEVLVGVDTDMLPGVYVDSISISSPAALNSPLYVVVIFEIVEQPRPALLVDSDTARFVAHQNGTLPSSEIFYVASSLYPTVFQTEENIDWLSLTDGTGNTGDAVTMNITTTDLALGVYLDSIYVFTSDTNFINTYKYVEYNIVDTIPPTPVADLAVDSNTNTSAFLGWTSSGDDGTIGTATETDIRYATDLTTLLNWTGATQATGEPTPLVSGSHEEFEITNLTPGSWYYLAMEIVDDVGLGSGISNVDSVYLPLVTPDAPNLISPLDAAQNIALDINFWWHSAVGAENYELQVDTDSTFASPSSFSDLTDTTYSLGPLEYETDYYWRVRAYNSDASSGWSTIWSFTTLAKPPTIAGTIKDSDGDPLADVLVSVFDSYPGGNVLDSISTDVNGRFEFFDLTGTFDLYALKDNYYPQVVPVTTTDTSLMIVLIEQPQFNPSDQWVDLYCDQAYSHGQLIQVNDVVEAYDPNGVLCGRFEVNTSGAYGFMPVYRDNPNTPASDEGCVTGDLVTLKVNGETAVTALPIVYPAGINQQIEACFDVTGEEPKFIVVFEPALNDTFYVDSSITINWTSTGITGPLELTLANSVTFPIPLDTIDNDGEHTFTVPEVLEASDWYLTLNDIDETTTGSSPIFTILSVELATIPDNLKFTGVIDACSPVSQKFKVNEVHGFVVPFSCSESIPWLSLTKSSGTTSGEVTVSVNSSGMALGTYIDSIRVESAGAPNSPVYVTVQLDVAEYLCGDFNNDCQIKTGDLTMLINYLYRTGPPPLYPSAANADLCDSIDVGDVEFWTSHFEFGNGVPCYGADYCTDQSYDNSNPDTLVFETVTSVDTIGTLNRLRLKLYLVNDGNTVNALASGFVWDNPKLHLDSTKFEQLGIDPFSFAKFAYEKNNIDTTNANLRFLYAAAKNFPSGIAPSPARRLMATYYFTVADWTDTDSVTFDRASYNLGTTYKIVTSTGSYQPVWGGAVTVTE